jgi:hypothetical protein
MKKTIVTLLLAAFVITVGSSCKKVVTSLFPGIDVRIPDVQVTIPPVIVVPSTEMSLGSFSASFNLDSIIKASTNNVFNINDIGTVKVKQVAVTLQNGDNLNNLANFETARVAMTSSNNSTETNILTVNIPDATSNTITVNATDSPDLKQYLSGNRINYTVYGKLRRPTTKSLNMVIAVTVRVE